MFSPHLLQLIVKSQCRVCGRLNMSASIGEERANTQCAFLPGCGLVMSQRACICGPNPNDPNSLAYYLLISGR